MGVSKSRLSDNDRARLDTIVQKMVANNESDSDIQLVVEDFKTKYSTNDEEPVKKKEIGSMASQFGGKAGASGGRSITRDEEIADLLQNNVSKTVVEPEVKEAPDEKLDAAIDPVKAALKPLRDKHAKAEDDFLSLNSQNRAVGESTKQANYGDRTQINASANLQSRILQDKKKIEKEIDAKASEFATMFPDGLKAMEYIDKKKNENGGVVPVDNETVQLAVEKVKRYVDFKKKIYESPDLVTAAINTAREVNFAFDAQITALEKSKYSLLSTDWQNQKKNPGFYANLLPKNVQGFYLDQLVHDPDVQVMTKEDPKLKAQIDTLKNGGIYEMYPEYGEIVARNLISKEYNRRRANIGLNPIFDNSKYLDNLADEMFANNPALKKIVDQRLKGNWSGKIDTKGVVDEFATGAANVFSGTGRTLKDVVGLGPSENKRLLTGMESEYGQVSSGVQGWQKDLGHAFNFGGMIVAMGALGRPLQGVGLTPFATNTAVTALTFWDDEKNKYAMVFPGQDGKSTAAATLSTLAFIYASKAFPSLKIADDIAGKMQPHISEALKSLENGTLARSQVVNLGREYAKAVGTFTKGVAEGVGHMEAITAFQSVVARMLNMSEAGYNQLHPDNQYEEVARSMSIGLLLPSLIHAAGGYNAISKNILHISENPIMFRDAVTQLKETGQITEKDYNQKIADINYVAALRPKMEGSKGNIGKALAASLYKKRLTDQIKGVEDKTMVADKEAEIKATEVYQEKALNPDMSNADVFEKLKKAGSLPLDAEMMLFPKDPETGKQKLKPEKINDYLEYVAQQANGFNDKWKPTGTGEADMEGRVPPVILDMANDMFAKRIIKAAKESVEPGTGVKKEAAQPKEDALKDVESTKKALKALLEVDRDALAELHQLAPGITSDRYDFGKENALTILSKEYHRVKEDGSNPELVKAVEDLLGKEPAVGDIESTTKSLVDVAKNNPEKFADFKSAIDEYPDEEGIDISTPQGAKEMSSIIAEEYHKAKEDGSNPELIKAVDDAIKQEGSKGAKPVAAEEKSQPEKGTGTTGEKTESKPGVSPKIKKKLEAFKEKHLTTKPVEEAKKAGEKELADLKNNPFEYWKSVYEENDLPEGNSDRLDEAHSEMMKSIQPGDYFKDKAGDLHRVKSVSELNVELEDYKGDVSKVTDNAIRSYTKEVDPKEISNKFLRKKLLGFDKHLTKKEEIKPEIKTEGPKSIRLGGKDYKPIGKNSEGKELFENEEGIRAVASDSKGIYKNEPVSIIPTKEGIEYSANRREEYMTTDELKIKANKKLSELMPGLSGEKEVEEEIKAKNGIQEKRDTIIKEHNAKVDELKKSAKPIQREIPDAKDFKPGFRFLNYDPEATRNGGIVEFEVVIGNHVDANGQTSREGDYYFKAKNLRTGKDNFFNTKEHLRDIQHQTRMFNNDLEPADKSKEIAALKKETDAKLAALTESEPKAPPKTASSKPVEPPKEVKRKIRDEQLKRDIDKGWDDFLSDSNLLKSGPLDPKKIEAGTKLVGLYIKGGVYKFSDILEDAYAKFGDKLHEFVDALKAVYGAFRDVEATDEQAAQMDTNLRGIKLDDIIKNLKNEPDNRGTGDAEKPSVVPPVDRLGKEPAQGDGAGHEEGGVSGVGDKESGGGAKSKGPTGKEDGSGPSRGDSEGKHDVALNGNEQLNTDLGGTTKEQPISKPEEQKPVVAPLQHNENFIVPPDFAHERSFNVGKRLQDNIDAIKILIKLKEEGRKPTYEEQKALFKYVGWGGIKEIGFDPKSDNGWSPSNSHLKKQIAEVTDLIQQLYPETHKENLAAIKSSVLNAHYTAIPVIRGMWDIIRKGGFKGGNVLEPSAGVGHFIGAMPIDFIEKSRIIGIELDPLTSEVLKGLYPNHIIRNSGYEETKIGSNAADLIISNIPFGNYKVFDKEFIKSKDPVLRKAANKVHTYFFARALQDVKPNGLVAFVTTTGVMDAKDNRELRQMIEERAEFLGAIRLPNDAFKGNANTQVTTDIIFLRKFGATEKPVQKHSFLDSQSVKVKHKDKDQMFNVSYNEYFHKNPEMVLGEVEAGSMYGASRDGLNDAMTVSPKHLDIQAEMTKLADKIFSKESSEKRENQKTELKETAETFVKSNGERVGNLVEISDGVYGISKGEKEDGTTEVEPIRVAKKYEGAVKDMIQIRAALNNLYAAEYGDLPGIEAKRAALNTAYKDFVKRNGTLLANKSLLEMDVDGHNMLALEKTEGKNVVGLADIFTKRVFQPKEKITKAKDLADAITINLNETGGVDIDRISELLKITPEQAIEQSKGLLFKNPQGGFETKDKYLSGNVRKKLEDAKIAAKEDPFYEQNVKALEEVQPQDLNAAQIYAPISASWINPAYVTDFASELLKQNIRVKRLSTGKVTVDGAMKYSTEVTDEFGTSRMDAFKIMEEVIQNRMPIVKDYTDDGRAIVNEAETQKAIQKAEKIKQAFDSWIWKNDDRRNDLVKHYNENFNNTVIRNYDGSHLVFDGFSGYLTPKKHQLDGVWMVMQQMGGILDHIVGSGKSLLMVLASKKMKESGLIKKPIILGLKANTADLAETYRKSFPMAKVLSPTEKDFSPENRKAFFAKMANNDWDAIIMTHDQFGMIEQPREVKMEIIQEEIDALEADIRNAKDHKLSKMDLNNLEKRKLNLRVKLQTLLSMTKDESLKSFEDMGVDFMFVDESQMFKNLAYNTVQRGVAGLGSPLGSNKAFNMLVATRHLQKMYGADKGTVFASGTPISNTMVEMYLLFKYLRPNKMAEMGIKSFDQWANTFARVGSEIEFGVTNSLKPKTRMREFMNVPEMAAMYREIADVRNDSNLKLDKPEFKKTIRIKTDKDMPVNEIVSIEDQKFKVIGRIKGVEKDEFWVSLKAIGKDPKIPTSGTVLHGDKAINYKDIEYSDGLLVNITPTVEQRRFAKRIQEFARTQDGAWINRPGLSDKEKKAYMLLATNLASKMAIDMRLVDPKNESSEVGKIAVAADSIVDHYKDSEKHKGIQLVFSDLGTPKSVNTPENLFNLIESRGVDRDTLENIFGKSVYNDKPKYPSVKELKSKMQSILEYTDAEFEDAVKEANEDNFNVYQEMKDKLVKRGIPADEIAFIHDYKSDRQRKELFSNARAGKIRVIIGSTSKLGTGVNVQDKIVALHHLDVPWRPSDMEQRNGRGIRQGNLVIKNNYDNELPVYMYATEGTLDAYKYQLLSTKQQFIDQAKSTDLSTREISEGEGDEENGVSFAAMTAMLSGNPVILEKAKIDKKVKELDSAKKAFQQEKYSLKDKISASKKYLDRKNEENKNLESDKAVFDKNIKKDEKTGEFVFDVTIDGEQFKELPKSAKEKTDKPEAEEGKKETVRQAVNLKVEKLLKAGKTGKIGSIYGFDIVISNRDYRDGPKKTVEIIGPSGHEYNSIAASSFMESGRGSSRFLTEISAIGDLLDKNKRHQELSEKEMTSKQKYLESLPEEFPKEKEYADAIEKQKQIQDRLTEMSQQEKVPDVEEIQSLGKKIDGSFDEISSRLNEGENNIYAVTEDNIVLRIKDPAEVEDAISKNSQFYTYEGEKLGGKSSEEEEDGADYQVKEQQSADITDMQDIVKDMVREGKSSLEDIQKTVAEELGDSSKKMRDLVESAYHEYGKSDATRPEQKGIAKAVAKRVGQTLSKMLGGGEKGKVEVLDNSDALLKKAEELGGGSFQEAANELINKETGDVIIKKNKIRGRLLNAKQSEALKKEIEAEYIPDGVFAFGGKHFSDDGKKVIKEYDDIRQRAYNYDHPYRSISISGVDVRISEGLIRTNKEGKKEKTYLLYADGKIVGEFYSVNDAANVVDYIKANLVKQLPGKTGGIEYMNSPDGKVLGFTKDGKIYLNGEHLNPNTPVHEAGHVWVDYVEKEKPAIYKKGVDLLSSERGNAYLQKAKDSKFYQEEAAKLPADQREAYFQKEALAMAIGDKGAQFVTEATKKGFREWLKTLWESVKSALGFKDITTEELADLTFDEFTKRAARDILSGEKTFEKERTETGEGETVGITHRATDELAKEMGLPDEYEKDPEQVAEWDAEAKQNIDEGKMPALIAKLKKGDMPDKVEQRMMLQYMAGIKAEYNRNPSDEILNHYREIKKLSDIVGGRDVAKSLVARKGMTEVHPLEGGILDALDAKMEALGVETLTDTQKQEMEALVKEYEQRAKDAEKKLKAVQAKKAKEDAENEIKKARNSKSSYKPKTHEERVAERDSIKEKARKALEALRSGAGGFSAVPAPGVRELIAIAPHVKDYVRSLAAEGLDNLHQAVIKVKDFFDDILEMEESDIRDIIAGVHDESKPTQNEAAARWRDLQAEAGLLKQIEDVYNGVPKTEKQRVQRNQRIKDLQDKLRKLKKDEGYDALDNLKSKIRRNKEEATKIRERIANKDFAPPKNTSVFSDRKLQYKYPAEYNAMLDALAEKENAKHDFDIALFRDELSRASKAEKVTNFLTKLTGTVKAIVTGIDDSAVAVQTYMALLLRPRTAATALKLHAEFAASQKKFNRWLTEVHNSPDYELIKNSGLNITEPQSLKAAEKEEIFSDRFNGTVKFKGKEYKLIDAPLKPFERAFTTLGNVTRLMAFRAKADAYYRKGYTFESHPELFKSLAQRLNTETGRGKENEHIERASKIVTMGIWSPKLMASKFNILGVSDFSSIALSKHGTKGYYRQLHPTERVEAIKDVAKFMVGVVAITYGAALAFGGQVDTDPLSPTFLDVKFQNGKRYNFTGGFSRYFAQIYQFIKGRQKIDGEVKDVNRITRQLPNFFRKKMPPVSSAIFGSFSGRNAIGKKTTPENEAIHLLQPMSVQGIVKQIQEDGASSLFLEGIPTFMGFNISSDKDFQKKETVVDPQTFEKRDKTQDEIKNEKELTTSNYADLMKKYRDNKLPIYMDKNGEVHLADPEMTDEALAFNITRKGWKKITFDKLNDQRQKFESKVKAKAKDAAQKKVYGVTLTEE